MQIQTIETEPLPPDSGALNALIDTIVEARQNIAGNFLTIGQALTTVKARKLYRENGFTSFAAFLHDSRIDIAPADAERFMSIAEDPAFSKQAALGLSKMLELLKLPPADRSRLMEVGANIKGQTKSIDQMNLRELKQASQEIKRAGKSRCERCSRWVDNVMEIDGHFYGTGSSHSCYEHEMEERRSLSAGRIPAAQLDNVLDTLRFETLEAKPELPPLQWLPDSLYQLYGQLLQDAAQSTGEVSREALEHEEDVLKKFMVLCQNRLKEIHETLQMLQELGEPGPAGDENAPPWD
ncbi:hypothetical protein COW36_06370 [bacterium (Candidatus Blackallbacteria) CG17_big_fil_post_rev_8_21_14_2_50_48_46]|uniref:Uncharacterized protein n=1 Tax=bacterium (Candidatus Blackallbacteria) CG17_big_fil_post_rev_8_21_14_2_50_48_46 TaxID=2014261 RepID=A0A2M7G7U6_9BACT|nr:MAG: hypothetical protein COW64_17200 [bacterium (Candidatus Blackallbacteria) CG18_big_fil_WC_8_21_14_2_50_49_26]PIW18150.1 MAG: hypothetical protein COW36_06370 [bacterium (Candidatus Blackallbacteria) CG17_big_fil_post_rev_8_21_14_2_50_48_46]PIW47015.1 MAG: hypothetical protein COW20_13875 [bacterium (Candidatus Blackallbacteria) CG13_big_fil_rev_8_21_14_2_50_49_14]